MAINPDEHKEAKTSAIFKFESGTYDVAFVGVGENDGQLSFQVLVKENEIGKYSTPVSKSSFEEVIQYNELFPEA